jgi:DNA repair exonuclease SbcCD ATPase subunit
MALHIDHGTNLEVLRNTIQGLRDALSQALAVNEHVVAECAEALRGERAARRMLHDRQLNDEYWKRRNAVLAEAVAEQGVAIARLKADVKAACEQNCRLIAANCQLVKQARQLAEQVTELAERLRAAGEGP